MASLHGSDVADDGILEAVIADLRLGTRFVLLSVVSWLAVTLLVSWWRRCVRFRRLELAIAGPKSLPLIGNALNLVGVNKDNTLDTVLGLWGGHYDELSRVSLFNQLIVFVTDPKHIQQVVSSRRLADKPDFYYKPLSGILGQGLVTANGDVWRAHRAAIVPTFHAKILEDFMDIFSGEARDFVERLRPSLGRDVAFTHDLGITAGNAVLRTVMPLTAELKARLEFAINACLPRAKQIVLSRSFKPWLWPSAVFDRVPLGHEMVRVRKYFHDLLETSLEARIDHMKAGKGDKGQRERKSFVDIMLEAKLEQRSDFTNAQIIEEVMTVFGAAIDTTVTSLTFAFKLLSLYRDVQRRVHDELLDVFGDGAVTNMTAADLPRLKYTERVLKETLRMFPSLPLIARHVPEDTELDGKLIPAGSVLVVNIFGAHRNPCQHPNPLDFDPDRFLPERAAGRHPCSYVPFSAGPRNCIGRAYAMMQMKTVLATTLLAYEILPADDGYAHPSQFPLTFDVTLAMTGDAKVRFEPRKRPVSTESPSDFESEKRIGVSKPCKSITGYD